MVYLPLCDYKSPTGSIVLSDLSLYVVSLTKGYLQSWDSPTLQPLGDTSVPSFPN